MAPRFVITFNGSYIEVVSIGSKSIAFARRMFAGIAEACREHECYRVLGISYSHDPVSIGDAFDHAELFTELGIGNRFRLAWVETNREHVETIEFIEDVLYNRGLPGKLFNNVEDARNWLVEPSRTD